MRASRQAVFRSLGYKLTPSTLIHLRCVLLQGQLFTTAWVIGWRGKNALLQAGMVRAMCRGKRGDPQSIRPPWKCTRGLGRWVQMFRPWKHFLSMNKAHVCTLYNVQGLLMCSVHCTLHSAEPIDTKAQAYRLTGWSGWNTGNPSPYFCLRSRWPLCCMCGDWPHLFNMEDFFCFVCEQISTL